MWAFRSSWQSILTNTINNPSLGCHLNLGNHRFTLRFYDLKGSKDLLLRKSGKFLPVTDQPPLLQRCSSFSDVVTYCRTCCLWRPNSLVLTVNAFICLSAGGHCNLFSLGRMMANPAGVWQCWHQHPDLNSFAHAKQRKWLCFRGARES